MLKTVPISKIKIGSRHRKEMGDLKALAQSIEEQGLLQPIGITPKFQLIFGERRLRAHKLLKRKTVLCRIIDVPSILQSEHDENEMREQFTPSERVAIGREIERKLGSRQGQRTDKLVGKFPQVAKGKTRDHAAKAAGFGNDRTYRQAKAVIEHGTEKLIEAMDGGKVSISAAAILADVTPREQKRILELDEKAILQAAKEIRSKQFERRKNFQDSKTVKPLERPLKDRIKATTLIHGDCVEEMKKLPSSSVDLILTDPPYPYINRPYGKMSEASWMEMMQSVVSESKRILKPSGSMVIIIQPNAEKVGKMRLWAWRFVLWSAEYFNLVQDAYWWSYDTLPRHDSKIGLLRPSVKFSVWLGEPTCYRNQSNVLCLPSERTFVERKEAAALRITRSGRNYRAADMQRAAEEAGGSSPFNLLPVAAGGTSAISSSRHPASTPYDVAFWWVKYLLPPKGVLLDPFCGSATMLEAGLDFGASKVIGIEKEKTYLKMAEKRVRGVR